MGFFKCLGLSAAVVLGAILVIGGIASILMGLAALIVFNAYLGAGAIIVGAIIVIAFLIRLEKF
jgi:hypothetical protein